MRTSTSRQSKSSTVRFIKQPLVFFCLIFTGMGFSRDSPAQNLVISNARIIVGNGTVIERGGLVVMDGRIASVAAGAADVPGMPAFDAQGMTLMPGFIDAHRHLPTSGSDIAIRMQEFLEAGYTTLMSGGGPVPGIVDLKRQIESGELVGPRIVTSGRADPDGFATPELARAQVRTLAQAGVEIIKARIDVDPSPQMEKLRAIIDEARRYGLDVMVHAVSVPAMLAAIDAGSKKLVHTPHFGWMTVEEAAKVRDADVHVLSSVGFGVPVFGVFNQDNTPTFRDGKPWPESIIDGEGRGREAGYKVVNGRTLWDAGVVYGYGTDTGYLPLEGLKHELRTLNLMFSPQDIVTLMGPNTAAFIGRSSELGTLEVGKLADIVVLDGNPLEGYWNFLNARVVIKDGRIVVDKR